MMRIRKFLKKLWTDQNAISSVEYALLLAFIAAGIIVAAELLSNAVSNELGNAAKCIEGTLDPTDSKCSGPE
jgi:Flp pilus assembly pilin Flp